MSSTGNVIAGTGENNAGIGVTAWTLPGNITADDAADATNSGVSGSQYLVARNFGFAIPINAVVLGVTVRIEASEHSAGTEDVSAQLQNESATLIGASKSATINGTAKAIYVYGGTTDKWGAAITPAMVNDADFGVRFWYLTTQDVRLDFVTMAIEYILPSWLWRIRFGMQRRPTKRQLRDNL